MTRPPRAQFRPQMHERPLSEADFQRQVTDLAQRLGWAWVHFRPARTQAGWRTPVSGPLGAGWPDLVLVRGPRMLLLELKSRRGRLTPAQRDVLALLADVAAAPSSGVEVHVLRAGDLDHVRELLR